MKRTALYQSHLDMGAKMVDFADFSMPLQFSSSIKEHLSVRYNIGIFDISHMGQFFIEGKQSAAMLEYITSNEVGKLYDGKAQYSCLMNENGGIVDDIVLYRMTEEKYMVVVNAANLKKDWEHFQKYKFKETQLTNLSDAYSLLSIQGPNSTTFLTQFCDFPIEKMPYYSFKENVKMASIENILISATGYTGSGGFEILVKKEDTRKLWDIFMLKGKEINLLPIGLAARDTLRMEMGFCLYGNEIDDTTTPLEANLSWITKLNTKFVGHEVLLKQKEKGVNKKLLGVELIEKGIPRKSFKIFNKTGKEIGYVTSGGMSPMKKKGIAMAYLDREEAIIGNEVFLKIRDSQSRAKVVKPPFVDIKK